MVTKTRTVYPVKNPIQSNSSSGSPGNTNEEDKLDTAISDKR